MPMQIRSIKMWGSRCKPFQSFSCSLGLTTSCRFSLAFFGTPHEGGNASLVRLGSTAARIATYLGFGANESIVMALQSGSVFADCLREAFRHRLGKYQIVSFWEGKGNVSFVATGAQGLRIISLMHFDADRIKGLGNVRPGGD